MHLRHFKQGGLPMLLQNGYNQKLSGDVLFSLSRGSLYTDPKGLLMVQDTIMTHTYHYCFTATVLRMAFLMSRTNVTDIAPTISALLGISFPSGATGTVIER